VIPPAALSQAPAYYTARSDYNFFEKLYLPTGAVTYPPPHRLGADYSRIFEKLKPNDAIVKLIKHIPYTEYPAEVTVGVTVLRR
jgi:hypothetical protein